MPDPFCPEHGDLHNARRTMQRTSSYRNPANGAADAHAYAMIAIADQFGALAQVVGETLAAIAPALQVPAPPQPTVVRDDMPSPEWMARLAHMVRESAGLDPEPAEPTEPTEPTGPDDTSDSGTDQNALDVLDYVRSFALVRQAMNPVVITDWERQVDAGMIWPSEILDMIDSSGVLNSDRPGGGRGRVSFDREFLATLVSNIKTAALLVDTELPGQVLKPLVRQLRDQARVIQEATGLLGDDR